MDCPVCKNIGLKEIRYHDDFMIDQCPACDGIWLDSKEIFVLAGNREIMKLEIRKALPRRLQSEKLSPITKMNMSEIPLFKGELKVDFCEDSYGIWLDGGEEDKLHILISEIKKKNEERIKKPDREQQRKKTGYNPIEAQENRSKSFLEFLIFKIIPLLIAATICFITIMIVRDGPPKGISPHEIGRFSSNFLGEEAVRKVIVYQIIFLVMIFIRQRYYKASPLQVSDTLFMKLFRFLFGLAGWIGLAILGSSVFLTEITKWRI